MNEPPEPISRDALWFAMIACLLVAMAAGIERSCESLEHQAINARHPLWVQIPVHALTPMVFVLAARKLKRMKPSRTAERTATILAWVLVLVNILVTTRLTRYFESRLTVRVLSVVIHDEYLPDIHDGAPCFRSYSRDFRSVTINGETISPPWLPLPVDWTEWDRWTGPDRRCSNFPESEITRNRHLYVE